MPNQSAKDQGPLDGVRVLAFEQAIALPFASFMLSELGADVIKVERPGAGDVIRSWDEAVLGLSSGFIAFNAGKRDITVDVSRPEGRDVIRRLAASVDVFLENFAPGVVTRLGIDHQVLREQNPRLIYCSLSGYGQEGPYRDVKAFDLLVQGESGILLNNGSEGSPAKVGMPITDQMAGAQAVSRILAALFERERTGDGCYIDVALLDSAFLWLGYYPQRAWQGLDDLPRTGMRHQFICPYGPFLASDGVWVNLAVASEEHWRVFCERVVERPDWLGDERFGSMRDRSRNRLVLDPEVEGVMAARPSAEWFDRLEAASLPFGRVRGMREVVQHPQLLARDVIAEDDSPVGRLRIVKMNGSRRSSRPVPGMGEHTEGVLAEAGYSKVDIERLRASGII